MTHAEARQYIWDAYSYGSMSQEEALDLLSLPVEDMIRQCEDLGERGDFYANL